VSYWVNEVFLSLQGEGVRAGTAAVFVRFRGCNLRCTMATHGFDCDTDFEDGRGYTLGELRDAVVQVAQGCRWVVLTGGEPGLQVDRDLVAVLREAGFALAIETNGTVDVSGLALDWVTVSPKVPEHRVQQMHADEVKYTMTAGQALPVPRCSADYQLLSPAHVGAQPSLAALAWCVELVLHNPGWRLSTQQHKAWSIR
jgi:organic radical activating enzyme